MKKIFCSIVVATFAFIAIGCGCGNSKTPEDFQVYSIELGGLTQEEFEVALKDGVENYCINVDVDGDVFPVSGKAVNISYNESLDLTDAVKKICKGTLTSEEIESDLFSIGTKNEIEVGLRDSYLAFLQATLSQQQALRDEADRLGTDTVTAVVTDDVNNNTEDSSATKSAGIATIYNKHEEEIDNASDGDEIEITAPTEEEIASTQQKIDDMVDVTRASIEYSESEGRYIGVDGKDGEAKDFGDAVEKLTEALLTLEESVKLNTEYGYKKGELVSESYDIQKYIDDANEYLNLDIAHIFNSPNGKSGRDEICGSDIHKYMYVGSDGRTLEVDNDSITIHVSSLVKEYSNIDETKEEDKANKKVTVYRKGTEPNSQSIFSNIVSCLEEKTSGEFNVEFKEVNETSSSNIDSTYVLVDLDAQQVSLYVDDEVLASGPIVSGCVSAGHATPQGTYSIYYKQRNAVLRGADYSCFVNYWMPFNGGIGLHDASWKSTFGGTEYFFYGSHGCINMPYSLAQTVYENVKAGTKVIVTGGVTSLDLEDPGLTGKTSYYLSKGDKVTLDVSANTPAELEYSSDDSSVATVDDDGNVVAVGKGTAYITVSCDYSADGGYDDGSITILIQVAELEPETTAAKETKASKETKAAKETTEAKETTKAKESSSTTEPSSADKSSESSKDPKQ